MKANNNTEIVVAFISGMAASFLGMLYPQLPRISSLTNKQWTNIDNVQEFALYIGIYLLVHYILSQVTTGKYQFFFTRIIENTIQHTIIFLAFYYSIQGKDDSNLIYNAERYLEIYFWARILFSIFYFFGTWMGKETFRAPFFGLGLGS